MGKFRYPLVNLVFWLAIIFSCYLVENVGLLTEQIFRGFDPVTFVVLFVGAIALYFVYFFLEHKKNKMKFDFVLLSLITVLFLVMAWNIWRQPRVTTITNISTGYKAIVSFSNFERIEYTLELLISLVGTYAVLFCYQRTKFRSRKLVWLPIFIIGYSAICCIGSIFTDFNSYKELFSGTSFENGARFFYYSENLFGYALLLGLLSCFIVNYHKKRWWTYVCIVWFIVQIALTTSITSLIAAVASAGIYFFVEIFCGFKKHPIRSGVFLIVYVSGILTAIALYFVFKNNGVGFVTKIDALLKNFLLTKDFSTLTDRTIVWHDALDLISGNNIDLWFGRGFRTSTELFRGYTAAMNNGDYVSSAHSAIFEILLRNGISGLILYTAGIIYYFYCAIRLLFKRKARFVLIQTLCVVTLLFQGIAEVDTFFTLNVTGTVETLMFLMPVITAYKVTKYPELVEEAKVIELDETKMDVHHLSHVISSVIMAIIVGVISTLLISKTYENKTVLMLILFALLLLVICLLFMPYLVSLFYKQASKKRFVIRCVIYGVIIFVPSMLIFFVTLFNKTDLKLPLIIIPVVITITFVFIMSLFMITKGGNIKEWAKDTFYGVFVLPNYGLLASATIGFVTIIILNSIFPLNYHSMICLSTLNMLLYLACFLFIPKRETKEIINYFNNDGLVTLKRLAIKDEL